MKTELKNLLFSYRQLLISDKLEVIKINEIKLMSQLLHNELYDMLSDSLGSSLTQFNELVAMGEHLINGPLANRVALVLEDGQMMIYFEKRKKPFLSAREIAQAALDTTDKDVVDLYTILVSNDSDLLCLNLLF